MAMAMAMAKQQVGGGGGGGGGGRDSNWEGMLKGWTPAHLDEPNHRGTYRPAHLDPPPAPRCLNCGIVFDPPPKNKWSFKGKAHNMLFMKPKAPKRPHEEDYDLDDRVYHLSVGISNQKDSSTPKFIEELLDELRAYAGDIDIANVLQSDGCLTAVLTALYSKHATIRAKCAELITAMLQFYPTSQQPIIDGNGLPLLLYNLTEDPDATSRTNALGAISALLRNNKPGITEFRLANGYAALKGPLSSDSVSLQRDALNLIQHLVHENSSDCNIVAELGIPCIMMHLACSDDEQVRDAALRGLLVLARDEEGGNSGQLVKNDDKLKQVLQKLIEGISAMSPEDLGSAREERQLVESLWNACYNEPSSLGEKGLLVLPGEDAHVPDVASKLFEPPLRALDAAEATDGNSSLGEKGILLLPDENAPAPDVSSKLFEPPPKAWAAAAEAADENSVSEKDCNIVTELVTKLGLHRIMMHLASSDDAEVREAALRSLLILARDEGGGNSGQLVKNDDKLKQVLQKLIQGISAMAPEDLGAAREERQLVESLWNACYNEPSSLGEKGLLVLPGEDAPAPDVAS